MPRKRISMDKVREIIRLKEQSKLGTRAIGRALNISRTVVGEYINKFELTGYSYDDIKAMDDDTLFEIIENGKKPTSERYRQLSEHFEYFAKELKRIGVTLQLLWQEYREKYPNGYGYSQFCYHYQVWRGSSELTMHIEQKVGDKMFVDFTGKHLQLVDRETGEFKDVEFFLAVLAASQYTYAEATASQKKPEWIKANVNAFHYFGGVPNAVVPDNLKPAVQNPNKYEPDINPEYAHFAQHYQTVILPARPGAARDKALVEGAVKIAYAWIFAALRNRIFYSLDELNQAIREELEKYNAKPMQKLKMSRKQLFDEIEKPALKPLPAEKYLSRKFKSLKVQFNYHIFLKDDNHYYSVPYRYSGKQVTVIYGDSVVEIFYKNSRIAFHKRVLTANGYSTIDDHMPSQHQFYAGWNPERFINWAKNIGPYVEVVVRKILENCHHPEQGYKVCLGILNLPQKFGPDRLNKACKRAIDFDHYGYKAIKKILDNNLENCQIDCFEQLPTHDNIRGKNYYSEED